ncbi:MAG: cell division protein FtsB [Steroidobacteraceae bacterium]|nr:cell division protein FtsB [Steroidobacteraceae bacterium]MDW8258594.1 cell division protein FtsB [Gammaproteobacteria bacterium]
MKWLLGALLIVTVALQYRLWLSDHGVREVARFKELVAAQRANNAELRARNALLAAEVQDLKQGLEALEERARSELGMVASNETFYQVVPRAQPLQQASAQSPATLR